jgi:mutator protein MutT
MKQITVRVYGLIFNEKNEILLSDEFALKMYLTKFPGGGLEYGEGTRDALKREIGEELGVEAQIGNHFYTTDFFQPALTLPDFQLLSIYYFVDLKTIPTEKISQKPFDKPDFKAGDQTFRFIHVSELSEETPTLPIDKVVARKLKKLYESNNLDELRFSVDKN